MRANVAAPDEWHIVTCEFPPDIGGVADYTHTIARGLAGSGSRVHVWCPEPKRLRAADAFDDRGVATEGVEVHTAFTRFSPSEMRRAGRRLDGFRRPARIIVQWVPQGYGYRSLNLPLACWLAWRAAIRGDELHVMVHEPFLSLFLSPAKLLAALVHRVMLWTVCRRASRVWVSIPAWADAVRQYVPRRTPVEWLPIPTPALSPPKNDVVERVRRRFPTGGPIVGHFGTYSPLVAPLLHDALDVVLEQSDASVLLTGTGSTTFLEEHRRKHPAHGGRMIATGQLAADDITSHISACTLMVQPYPDGISGRRTSALTSMALGVPIVSNDGSLSEAMWRNERIVALAARPDGRLVGQLAAALLRDPSARHAFAAAARQTYNRLFDVRHAVAKFQGHADDGTAAGVSTSAARVRPLADAAHDAAPARHGAST